MAQPAGHSSGIVGGYPIGECTGASGALTPLGSSPGAPTTHEGLPVKEIEARSRKTTTL
jgi:hypothetical protein